MKDYEALVGGLGELVEIASDLAELSEKTGKLVLVRRGTAHGPGNRPAKQGLSHIAAGRKAGLRCAGVQERALAGR